MASLIPISSFAYLTMKVQVLKLLFVMEESISLCMFRIPLVLDATYDDYRTYILILDIEFDWSKREWIVFLKCYMNYLTLVSSLK
jgi:hypothetical protein